MHFPLRHPFGRSWASRLARLAVSLSSPQVTCKVQAGAGFDQVWGEFVTTVRMLDNSTSSLSHGQPSLDWQLRTKSCRDEPQLQPRPSPLRTDMSYFQGLRSAETAFSELRQQVVHRQGQQPLARHTKGRVPRIAHEDCLLEQTCHTAPSAPRICMRSVSIQVFPE